MEAGRNPLCQRGGNLNLVRKAKIPDGDGGRTATYVLDSAYTYSIPTGCDGFVAQAILPLSGKAPVANLLPAFVHGGLMTIPTNGLSFPNQNWNSKMWDDIATLLNAIKYTRNGVDNWLPMRVVGFALNVKSADSTLNRAGTLYGGQLEMPVCTSTTTTGGFVVGAAYNSACRNMTYAEMEDCLHGMSTTRFTADEGVTVRVLLNRHGYRRFSRPSDLPQATSGVSLFGDCSNAAYFGAGSPDFWTAGRDFVPTAVVQGAPTASKWEVTARVILEIDNTVRQLPFVPATYSPHSDRYEYLNYIIHSGDQYPGVVSGHSFWPTLKEFGRGLFKVALPILAGAAAGELASPAGPLAVGAASLAARQLAQNYVDHESQPPKRKAKKKKTVGIRIPRRK